MNTNSKSTSESQINFDIEFGNFSSGEEESENEEEEIEEIVPYEENTCFDLSTFKSYDAESTLSVEERLIIEKCTDEQLKNLLLLNRAKYTKLIHLFKTIKDLLVECQQNIKDKTEYIKTIDNSNSTNVSNIWKIAAPYFKDKKLYCSPFNDDALKKKLHKEIPQYEINKQQNKWSSVDCDTFLRIVQFNYHFNKQKELNKELSNLKLKINKATTEEGNTEEIQALEAKLEGLQDPVEDDFPPRFCDDYIDWFRISDFFLKGRHSPLECRSFWNNYIHPTINKSEWTIQEDTAIKALAKKYKFQNWDKIAEELGTDRSGFSTCLHYYSVLDDKYKRDKFTPEEDAFLIDVVKKCKIGKNISWVRVADNFPDRSRVQLYHRYMYYLARHKKNIICYSKFSEAEDVLILCLINKFGKRFNKCAEYITQRTAMQIKNRYNSNLQKNINKGSYTTSDDIAIVDYVKQYGEKSWSKLAKILNRSRGQVRQRYMYIKQCLIENPKIDVTQVAKRKHKIYDKDKNQYEFLQFVASKYKNVNYIPTLEMIENTLRHTSDVSTSKKKKTIAPKINKRIQLKIIEDVDTMLIEFFSNAYKMKSDAKVLVSYNYTDAAQDIKCLLGLLQVNLSIPDNLKCNNYLDDIDVELLNKLKVNKPVQIIQNPKCLFPPNVNTLVGMRSLIIKHFSFKKQCKRDIFAFLPINNKKTQNEISYYIEKELQELSPSQKETILSERRLFKQRFLILFLWPSYFSLNKPNECLLHQNVPPSQTTKDESSSITTISTTTTTTKRQITRKTKQNRKKPKLSPPTISAPPDSDDSDSELIITDLSNINDEQEQQITGESNECDDLSKLEKLLKCESNLDDYHDNYDEDEITKNEVLILQKILASNGKFDN